MSTPETPRRRTLEGTMYRVASGAAPPEMDDTHRASGSSAAAAEAAAAEVTARASLCCPDPLPPLPPGDYVGWSPLAGSVAPIPDPVYPQSGCGPGGCFPRPFGCNPCGFLGGDKYVVQAQQPVVPVPVYQEVQRRDRVIEVPQTVIRDKIVPKLFHQEVQYEVPKLNLNIRKRVVKIPRIEFKQKIIEVPIAVGFRYKAIEKCEIRPVPKIVPRYIGRPKDIFVEIPQIKVVDKTVEKEVPVYVGERRVKKEIVEEEEYEVIQDRHVEKEVDVPVYRYKPVFDVQVDFPSPLIVPVPVAPDEVRLEPVRLSLDEWKKERVHPCNVAKCVKQCV